ncbi:translation initiation factor IF-2-like [Nycticebus coucang]|uniref:translation initiation factor IF-2-like n=1 Tax=Nycticebus coucang TaxID=9470 RepID=UPI00234D29F0|nr:translation initiation factor IF-2-like [Nycticebus coucang]
MQIGSLPPRPSPREAGGGRGGERGGGDAGRGGGGEELGRGARRAPCAAGRSGSGGVRLQPAERPPARRGPAPAVATARLLRALQPRRHPRGTAPGPLPGAPARAATRPRLAFRGRAGRPRGAKRRRAAFRHRGPAWQPLARPGALRSSAAAPRAGAVRCTCSSAGPQPTLGQHSPGETNPSAARRASGPARLGSPRSRRPPLRTAAAAARESNSSERRCREPGAHRAPAEGVRRPASEGTRQPGRGLENSPSALRGRAWGAEAGDRVGDPWQRGPRAGGGSGGTPAAGRMRVCAPNCRGGLGFGQSSASHQHLMVKSSVVQRRDCG